MLKARVWLIKIAQHRYNESYRGLRIFTPKNPVYGILQFAKKMVKFL
jgi:hypothetical protein